MKTSIEITRGFDWLRLLPLFWVQNDPTNRAWDWTLNQALDKFGVRQVSQCVVQVGPFEVWVENWPYAFGYNTRCRRGLPLAKTRRRLQKMLKRPSEWDAADQLRLLAARKQKA